VQEQTARLGDLALPTAVVAVVGMMVFPLPVVVLDSLLMCNIAFALSLLISSVYLSQPEKFTALPTMLLLSTLFRLGLNISTTRQLLSEGEAPEIVIAFGNFVVGGNLVVGAVIFSILTIIQFLVIAKGSERVAEVAARFTLDAMPGKQMSIDADVRAGMLSLLEARERRLELQRESKLYGALDGAMKFIKGDVIAGLLISVVNIVAGLFVGVSQHGLGLSEALSRYTLFTIGDGLCSQIPSLLVAVAAGIAVTRVADKDGSFIGRDMFAQLSHEPQALFATSAILMILAFVPGLPAIPFMGMSALLCGIAGRGKKKSQENLSARAEETARPKIFSPVVVRLSSLAAIKVQQEQILPELLARVKLDVFEESGVLVPDIQFDLDRDTQSMKATLYLHGESLREFSGNNESHSQSQRRESPFSSMLAGEIKTFVTSHLAELVDDTQTRTLLELHSPVSEDLINSVVPDIVSVTALTQLLRQMVLECVPIREIGRILQAIAEHRLDSEHGAMSLPNASLVQSGLSEQRRILRQKTIGGKGALWDMLADVRVALGRTISKRVCASDWILNAHILDIEVDQALSKIALGLCPLDPDLKAALVMSFAKAREDFSSNALTVLCSKYTRGLLWSICHSEALSIKVIAAEEMCSEVKLKAQGVIVIPGFFGNIQRAEAQTLAAEAVH